MRKLFVAFVLFVGVSTFATSVAYATEARDFAVPGVTAAGGAKASSAARWEYAVRRAGQTNGPAAVQQGFAFEVFSKDAYNRRQPWNRLKLENNVNAEAVDGFKRNGQAVQQKLSSLAANTDKRAVQKEALKKLDKAGYKTGEVWVPKGNKVGCGNSCRFYNVNRVKESTVSVDDLVKASESNGWLGAKSAKEVARKGGKFGGVISAVVEAGFEGWDLWTKYQSDNRVTLEDWARSLGNVVKAGACGVVSGTVGAAVAATPVLTPVGGFVVGFVTGGVSYWFCDSVVTKVADWLKFW